jgi:hypothetical protein
MNRECVSHIMKPGLEVGTVATLDACDPSQAREVCTGNLGQDWSTALRLKQRSMVLVSSSGLPEVLPDQPHEIRSERHEARFTKLCVAYRNEAARQIHIHDPEMKYFAEPHACRVQKQQNNRVRNVASDIA